MVSAWVYAISPGRLFGVGQTDFDSEREMVVAFVVVVV